MVGVVEQLDAERARARSEVEQLVAAAHIDEIVEPCVEFGFQRHAAVPFTEKRACQARIPAEGPGGTIRSGIGNARRAVDPASPPAIVVRELLTVFYRKASSVNGK